MGLTVVLRLIAEVDGAMPVVDATVQLVDGHFAIPERQRRDSDQAVRIGAAPVGQEVVVGADTRGDQFTITEAEEVAVAESADVRIHQLGL